MKKIILRKLVSLLHHGIENYTSEREIRSNAISNVFFMFFTPLTAILMVTLCILTIMLQNEDPEKYAGYLLYYQIPPAITLATIVTCFFLKTKYPQNSIYLVILIIEGTFFISVLSAMLGKDTNAQIFMLALVPLPFFLLNYSRRKLIYLTEIYIFFAVIATNIYLEFNEALLPMPYYIEKLITLLMMSITAVSLFIICFYFWIENSRAEELILISRHQLKEKDYVISYELDLARQIQSGMLPDKREDEWKDIRLCSHLVPMTKVSGDYFDYFKFDDCFYILIVDASGHGVPAAFITMLAKQIFTSLVEEKIDPAEIMHKANIQLRSRIVTQEYLTAFLIKIDSEMNLTYASGGHTNPIYYSSKRKKFFKLDTDGAPLGLFKVKPGTYESKSLKMNPGDRIVLYTDGITEQMNKKDEQFTVKRLVKSFRNGLEYNLETSFKSILKDLEDFQGARPQEDDITLLAFERVS